MVDGIAGWEQNETSSRENENHTNELTSKTPKGYSTRTSVRKVRFSEAVAVFSFPCSLLAPPL